MILSKECYERGCACHDDRVDEGIEIEPQREWVGLTDEEIEEVYKAVYRNEADMVDLMFADELEAKLKEKNYGK